MKLPQIVQQLFKPKTEPHKELFLSLVLDVDVVEGAAWEVDSHHKPHIRSTALHMVKTDSWEDRTDAADQAITTLEDATGTTDLHKVVFGLPATYLTHAGDIEKSIRSHIKKLSDVLDLAALGFVPLHQAIVYTLKQDEGVPPNVVLIGLSGESLIVSLYKIGALAGQKIIEKSVHTVEDVEKVLKSFTDVEVLPSRMLVYGGTKERLEEVKRDLLRYPWQTKANFLHFPKIDLISPDVVIAAVATAGASELATTIGEESSDSHESQRSEVASHVSHLHSEDEQPSEEKVHERRAIHQTVEIVEEETPPKDMEANVVMVNPEELGFQRDDGLEHTTVSHHPNEEAEINEEEDDEEEKSYEPERRPLSVSSMFSNISFPRVSFPAFPRSSIILPVIIFLIVISGIAGFLYWTLPHAMVTVLEISQPIDTTMNVVVDPTATVVASDQKIIPGKRQEASVSGEKLIPVTGKKKVGDPAKGVVTIYNKSLSTKTFKKGTVLSSGSLQFTLDSEIEVASASENLSQGAVTYGKATGNVTAISIGPQSNLSSGSEFVFKDYASSVAIARSDQAFSGGTSRDVTVVSRADYDNLVKVLTQELVEKAKEDLLQSVEGKEKLIDTTVKTTVTQKSFTEELDQEATELHGKLTIGVSGISYSEDDIRSFLQLTGGIPEGYVLSVEHTTVTLGDARVQKDGKITATASFHGVALPVLDTKKIQKDLAGKTLLSAQRYLQSIPGVGGMEVGFRWSPSKERFPSNPNNISVSLAIQ